MSSPLRAARQTGSSSYTPERPPALPESSTLDSRRFGAVPSGGAPSARASDSNPMEQARLTGPENELFWSSLETESTKKDAQSLKEIDEKLRAVIAPVDRYKNYNALIDFSFYKDTRISLSAISLLKYHLTKGTISKEENKGLASVRSHFIEQLKASANNPQSAPVFSRQMLTLQVLIHLYLISYAQIGSPKFHNQAKQELLDLIELLQRLCNEGDLAGQFASQLALEACKHIQSPTSQGWSLAQRIVSLVTHVEGAVVAGLSYQVGTALQSLGGFVEQCLQTWQDIDHMVTRGWYYNALLGEKLCQNLRDCDDRQFFHHFQPLKELISKRLIDKLPHLGYGGQLFGYAMIRQLTSLLPKLENKPSQQNQLWQELLLPLTDKAFPGQTVQVEPQPEETVQTEEEATGDSPPSPRCCPSIPNPFHRLSRRTTEDTKPTIQQLIQQSPPELLNVPSTSEETLGLLHFATEYYLSELKYEQSIPSTLRERVDRHLNNMRGRLPNSQAMEAAFNEFLSSKEVSDWFSQLKAAEIAKEAPVLVQIPYQVDHYEKFVGREKDIKELMEAIQAKVNEAIADPEQPGAFVVIHALGGIGKTSTANELIVRMANEPSLQALSKQTLFLACYYCYSNKLSDLTHSLATQLGCVTDVRTM